MKKLAIIALAALTLAPSAASAMSWHDFTCRYFNSNCHRSTRYSGPWWETREVTCDIYGTRHSLAHLPEC